MKNLSLRHSDAVTAWATNNPVELVTAAVGALDRFLLGMVCLVFGLGSYELFLARSAGGCFGSNPRRCSACSRVTNDQPIAPA